MATGDDKFVQVVAELFGRLALEGQAVLRTPAQENSQAERARARRPSKKQTRAEAWRLLRTDTLHPLQ